MKPEDLENIYTYHAPKDDQPQRYEAIREEGKIMASLLLDMCPESRERSVALRRIEEAVMYANASIARNE